MISYIASLVLVIFVEPKKLTYQIHILNVGHGMSVLIQNPTKTTNILLDAGSGRHKINPTLKIVRYLKALGINSLNAVFLSHQDNDHHNNITTILENIAVDKI